MDILPKVIMVRILDYLPIEDILKLRSLHTTFDEAILIMGPSLHAKLRNLLNRTQLTISDIMDSIVANNADLCDLYKPNSDLQIQALGSAMNSKTLILNNLRLLENNLRLLEIGQEKCKHLLNLGAGKKLVVNILFDYCEYLLALNKVVSEIKDVSTGRTFDTVLLEGLASDGMRLVQDLYS